MPAVFHVRRIWLGGWVAATLGAFTGCGTNHSVMIDAISHPAKPMGTSYRLEVHDPSGGVDRELGAHAIANCRDALAARGLHEAPDGTRPDMIIDFEYGRGPGQVNVAYRAPSNISKNAKWPPDPATKLVTVYEKYIQLTAREPAAEAATPPPAGRPRERGEELWSVRVGVEDEEKELAPYLSVLASVSVEYIGRNSGKETHVEVDARKAAGALRHPRPLPSPNPG